MVVRGNTIMTLDTDVQIEGQTAVAHLHQQVSTAFARSETVTPIGAKTATVVGQPKRTAQDLRSEARIKGYEGESCGECHNFTLVRNGTCLKCETCGSTSGCS